MIGKYFDTINDERSSKHIPFVITFLSAHHSPNTVKRKASEFVIGTVRLSSSKSQISHSVTKPTWTRELTSLSNQQEKPHTPSHVDQEWDSISWVLQNIVDAV